MAKFPKFPKSRICITLYCIQITVCTELIYKNIQICGRGGSSESSPSTAPHSAGPRKPSRPEETYLSIDSKAIRGDEWFYAVLVTRSCGVTTGVALRALGCPARACTPGGAHQNRSRGLSLPRYVSHLLSAPKRRSVSLPIICLQTY